MFNLSGSEIVVILLLALIVLGPDKLPDAMRRAGKTFAELKKLSSGFQDEVRKGFEEPVKEVKKTAATVKSATKFTVDTTATEASDRSVDKPRYNPATDPPPELPEGSSVADPLTESEAESAPEPAIESTTEMETESGPAAGSDSDAVVADESPAAAESAEAVEADRTA